MTKIQDYQKYFLFFFLIVSLIFTRFFNINHEDLWFDEIISFWISDPEISFKETIFRNEQFNNSHKLYHLILKLYFKFFHYIPEYGRYLNIFFDLFSLLLLLKLIQSIKKNHSYFLLALLLIFNHYLISYAHELRTYSFFFFISSLSIFLFFEIYFKQNVNKFFYILYFFTSVAGLFTHNFYFIIFFSKIIFCLYEQIILKIKNSFFFFILILSLCSYLVFELKIITGNLSIRDFWTPKISKNFWYDFFFSRFFGSKIVGTLHLLIFIFLVVFFFKKILQNRKLSFFLLLFFLCYFIPLTYSILIIPVFIDRFIIFVLIPLFFLVSLLTVLLKKKTQTYILLALLISNLSHYVFTNYKRVSNKPEFSKSIQKINESDNKFVILQSKIEYYLALKNYFKNIKKVDSKQIKIIEKKDLNTQMVFWQLCYEPINDFNCFEDLLKNKKYSVSEEAKFKLIKLYKFTTTK